MKNAIAASLAALALTLTACTDSSPANAAPTVEEAMEYEYVETVHDGVNIYREPDTDNHHLCIMYGEAPGYEFITDTGCSEAMTYDGVTEAVMASWSSAFEAAEPPAQAAPAGPEELELGETAHLVQGANGPRNITVTIDDISVSDQCHQGHNNYSDGYHRDHGYFIQATGEFEVIEHQVNFSVGTYSWNGTTEDGYAVTFESASECNSPHDDMPGYQSFSNPIDAGQKARAIEEYWVEELPTSMILTGPYEPVDYAWPVPAQ